LEGTLVKVTSPICRLLILVSGRLLAEDSQLLSKGEAGNPVLPVMHLAPTLPDQQLQLALKLTLSEPVLQLSERRMET